MTVWTIVILRLWHAHEQLHEHPVKYIEYGVFTTVQRCLHSSRVTSSATTKSFFCKHFQLSLTRFSSPTIKTFLTRLLCEVLLLNQMTLRGLHLFSLWVGHVKCSKLRIQMWVGCRSMLFSFYTGIITLSLVTVLLQTWLTDV